MGNPSSAECLRYDEASTDAHADLHADLHVGWRVAAMVWVIPALFSAMVSYTFTRITGSPVAFWTVLVVNIPIWYFWAFATPVIFWLGRAARVGWPVSPSAVAIHLVASVFAALADVLCGMSISALLGVTSLGEHIIHRYIISVMSWLVTGVLTYWAVLGAGYALEFDRKYRRQRLRSSELAAQLARAQLSVLRNQLHPHFLFNTLNTAVSLVRVHRTETAVGVLTDLSEILRRLLHRAPDQEITLREELSFLNAYVAIERLRFSDRLSVQVRVPDDVMNALVPNLLLQPLVENAIRYGVGRDNSAGHVDVSAQRQGGRLVLQVRDDGPGLPVEWHANGTSGVGLANTQERLQQMYGPLHEFLLGNAATGGAEVTITIPLHFVTDAFVESQNDSATMASTHA